MLALKRKVKRHFMKQGDNTSKGSKHYNDSLFLFSTSKFELFFVSKMNVEKSFVEKLQRQSREKLQNLKEEQERLRKQQKFANILPLQYRSLERGSIFSSLVYSSSSSQKSSLISKFERIFEKIRKNEKDCQETLKRYSFRKPKRHASSSEQVGPISISYSKEDHKKDNNNNNHHYIKRIILMNKFQKKFIFPTRSTQR